jgi:hypothetical protein
MDTSRRRCAHESLAGSCLRAGLLIAFLLAIRATGFAENAMNSQGQMKAPTDAELKMTTDAKAPGADAVILDYEQIADDQERFTIVHMRIKVLTEKGKELATVQTPYDHNDYTKYEIDGRTIHTDGVIVPLTEKAKELTDLKAGSLEERSLVFNLASVEVGSILEYRILMRYGYSLRTWEIQQKRFVHHAHFSFRPSSYEGVMYATRIATGAKPERDKKGFFTLDIDDVPPLPDEDWMPPLNSMRWQVDFYYSRFTGESDFLKYATKSWAEYVDDFAKPTGTLKQAVAGLISPADSETDKANKIYEAVQKLDNTVFSRTKSHAERKKEKLKDIKKAEDVWKQKSGSDDELTLLFIAMARIAGLHVDAMQVVDRNRAIYDSAMLSTYQLDDFLAVVQLGGKDVYVDPGQKACPFGLLHWKHTLATGLRQKDKDAVMATTPGSTFKETAVQRAAYLVVDAEGKIDGVVRVAATGNEALYWRQLSLSQDDDEVKKQFNEWVKGFLPSGIEGEFDHFLGLEDSKALLVATVKVSGQLGVATGKRYFLPGLFFEVNATHPFVTLDERKSPIDVQFARTVLDDVTYKLPDGYAMEGAAPAADVTWPGFAAMRIAPTVKGGEISVQRLLQYNFVMLNSKHYPELHGFYQKVATADQQQLVLTKSAAGPSVRAAN